MSYIHNILLKINPELAHKIALFALKNNFMKNKLSDYHDFLKLELYGLNFSHPVGLAAGFDKNADCVQQLINCGFSFIEVGTVTNKPQSGNATPRIFCLKKDKAIINRLGFNNKGLEYFQNNIKSCNNGVIGINIGKNTDAEDAISDYVSLIKGIYLLADYITINISSPNTPHLRDLQQKDMLEKLLIAVLNAVKKIKAPRRVPILLKISPDITDEYKKDIAALTLKYGIDGLILTNTTIGCRNGLKTASKIEYGGLSGKPLFELSTRVLGDMYQLTDGSVPLIGSGGVFNGHDAYKKIKAGASLIQIYTTLIYGGFKVINKINLDLIQLLKKDGFSNIKQAIGSDFR